MEKVKYMYYNNFSTDSLPEEIWIDVFGLDGLYEVSNLGRVKSVGRFVKTNKGSERWNKERILRQGNKTRCVTLSVENKQYGYTVQRLVYESFNQDFVDEGNNEVVERINKVKDNNRLENLRKVTIIQSRKNTTKKGCMIFERLNKYTKEKGVFKNGTLVSKECKNCNSQVEVSGFTYGVNTCKNCRNKEFKKNYVKREQITYAKLNGNFKKGVLISQKCKSCNIVKKIDLFQNSGIKGGRCSRCRDCTNTYYREKKLMKIKKI